MVGVAQSVEHQIVDLVVVGSSPIVHPTYNCFGHGGVGIDSQYSPFVP